MARSVRTLLRLAVAAVLGLVPATALASPVPAEKPKDIDLVLCLDVSNSMDGLIDSAKLKLWDIVNELAKVKPTPNLRVSLYSYGHNSYPRDAGWVRKDLDLTSDLDEVYARLNALKTSGGTEFVARVSRAALTEQKWTDKPNALKLVFVCGNEPASQDKEVKLTDVGELAKKSGVIVNTIYCGPAQSAEAEGYRTFALMAGGAYANINQDQAKKDIANSIKTPFDEQILKLSNELNKTYVAYGARREEGARQQVAQDGAAAANAAGAAISRAESKANALYRNATWDAVDRLKEDPKFDITKLKDEELCEELRKLKPEERVAYVKKKAEEREKLQKEINDLSAKRSKVIEEERKKLPKSAGEQALDEALKSIIRDQAKSCGFEVPAAGPGAGSNK
jgi:hypothetical protein